MKLKESEKYIQRVIHQFNSTFIKADMRLSAGTKVYRTSSLIDLIKIVCLKFIAVLNLFIA